MYNVIGEYWEHDELTQSGQNEGANQVLTQENSGILTISTASVFLKSVICWQKHGVGAEVITSLCQMYGKLKGELHAVPHLQYYLVWHHLTHLSHFPFIPVLHLTLSFSFILSFPSSSDTLISLFVHSFLCDNTPSHLSYSTYNTTCWKTRYPQNGKWVANEDNARFANFILNT
jgi:hypothetical protein